MTQYNNNIIMRQKSEWAIELKNKFLLNNISCYSMYIYIVDV